ncbi:MAG: AEC family transporter [Oceanipulchritudo sp.]
MAQILSTLFPVFMVLGIGYALCRKGFLSRQFLNELNRFVYYVALPALILHRLSTAPSLPLGVLRSVLIFLAATLFVMAVAYGVARILRLQHWQYGTFMQASFRGNLAFIGIPILVYAIRDKPPETASSIVTEAIFIFAPIMVLYNILSVLALTASQEDGDRKSLLSAIKGIATNPLILAAFVGIILLLLPFPVPRAVSDTMEFLGRIAAPAALVCVGGAMAVVSMQGRYRSAFCAALLKTALTPIVAYLFSLPFDLAPHTQLILMIFSATPTAVASFVMAKELYGDDAMASGGIVLSTLLSVISLAVVVGFF